jgi:hypothetical protein
MQTHTHMAVVPMTFPLPSNFRLRINIQCDFNLEGNPRALMTWHGIERNDKLSNECGRMSERKKSSKERNESTTFLLNENFFLIDLESLEFNNLNVLK